MKATTCPYGDLNQHLNGTANCEDPHCVYSVKEQTDINLEGSRAVLHAIKESEKDNERRRASSEGHSQKKPG